MSACVIDASTIAAAFFQEEFEQRSWELLASGCSLLAPDLIFPEVANVVCKRFRHREIDAREAKLLISDLQKVPLKITSSESLVESALEIAITAGRSAYDSIYLALAVKTDSIMVTADKRLTNALAGSPLEKYVEWLGAVR